MNIPLPGVDAYNAPGADGKPYNMANDRAIHPFACFFTLFFKIAAIMVYLFCGIFTDSFIITFVTVVMLIAFDFWTVKNVSGRYLVGLRWWNDILPDGTNKWIFESKGPEFITGRFDSLVFWGQLYATPLIWIVVGVIMSGLSPRWLLVVAVAATLSMTNLIGYWRCQKDAGKNLKNFVVSQAVSAAINNPEALKSAASSM